jgi:hypothetical protein
MLSRAQMADQAIAHQAQADQAQGLPLHSCCWVVVGEWMVCWIASTYRQNSGYIGRYVHRTARQSFHRTAKHSFHRTSEAGYMMLL